jgi:hypothetical protein
MATSQKTILKSMKSKTMTIELPFFIDVVLNEEHEEVDEYKFCGNYCDNRYQAPPNRCVVMSAKTWRQQCYTHTSLTLGSLH